MTSLLNPIALLVTILLTPPKEMYEDFLLNFQLPEITKAVLAANSASKQEALKGFDLAVTECEHGLMLEQDPSAPKLGKKCIHLNRLFIDVFIFLIIFFT